MTSTKTIVNAPGIKIRWKAGAVEKTPTNSWDDLLEVTWQNQWRDKSFARFRSEFQNRVTGWTGRTFAFPASAEDLYRALAAAGQLEIVEDGTVI